MRPRQVRYQAALRPDCLDYNRLTAAPGPHAYTMVWTMARRNLIVAITGATGTIFGVRMLQLLQGTDVDTHVVISRWGARTLATNAEPPWRYIPVRRTAIMIEQSIYNGIQWAVFEPNDLGLWQQLKRSISAFLRQQWVDGALFGATPQDAFYVRIDEVLNPFVEQQLGRLHIEIGVRPAYPAEFIIVRIGIWPGGSEITEG